MVATTAGRGREIVVDVREQLRAGKEPFSKIMAAAESCAVGDTLVLYATFKPVPLLMLLKRHGFEGEATKIDKGDWRVDFRRVRDEKLNAAPRASGDSSTSSSAATADGATDVLLDHRGLEPPEPMVRTLEAIRNLQDGQRIVGKFDRTPMFLLPKLDEMGYRYAVAPEADGRATVTIWQDDEDGRFENGNR